MSEVDIYAKRVWDYMLMHQEIAPADAIFVLGSNDTRVAERAADLYHQGLAPVIIFSGNKGKEPSLSGPEAEVFAQIAIERGVPETDIIREPEATNTGENILFTRRLLEERGLDFKKFILVQKPYMERRTYATFRKQWPEAACVVTSPQIPFEDYIDPAYHMTRERFLNTMVGDLLRIKEYPAKGYQIPQEIPEDVWDAGQKLLALGYSNYAV